MVLHLPLVLVLVAWVALLVQGSGLKAGHAVTCLLLGFFLAPSSAAPPVNDAVTAVLDVLGRVRF